MKGLKNIIDEKNINILFSTSGNFSFKQKKNNIGIANDIINTVLLNPNSLAKKGFKYLCIIYIKGGLLLVSLNNFIDSKKECRKRCCFALNLMKAHKKNSF